MSGPKSMRILGLDPGTAVTGWGVIDHTGSKSVLVAHGTIVTSARQPAHERLSDIYRAALEVIDLHQPQAAAIEELFGGVNLKTALAVGQARGVLVLACAERGVVPADYTPLRIKQAVVGYGRASKVQVQQMVKALLALPKVPKPDHAADALGVAICHAHSMNANYAVQSQDAPSSPAPRLKKVMK
ncbi:MAG: crossover junction endodeoxyribonuclease RuvC [Thermoleophilia bacterium]